MQPLYLAAAEQGARCPSCAAWSSPTATRSPWSRPSRLSLARIFGGRVRAEERGGRPAERPAAARSAPSAAIAAARPARLGGVAGGPGGAAASGDWAAYGQEQKRLEDVLRQLQGNRQPRSSRRARGRRDGFPIEGSQRYVS